MVLKTVTFSKKFIMIIGLVLCLLPLVFSLDNFHTDANSILDIIENTDRNTCNPGTENVVDLNINTSKWDEQRTPALINANFMSQRLNMPTFDRIQELALYNFVKTAVLSTPMIFAASIAFTENRFERSRLLAPFAHRDGSMVKAFDLSTGYDYLNSSWFVSVEDVSPDELEKIMVTTTISTGEDINAEVLYADAENGKWTLPYFDCGGGNIWMVSYSVPIFGPDEQGNQMFSGIASIDIDLSNLDINQCDDDTYHDDVFFNTFKGTHRCPTESNCIFEEGYGFRRGGYSCECGDGSIIDGEFLESASLENLEYISCPSSQDSTEQLPFDSILEQIENTNEKTCDPEKDNILNIPIITDEWEKYFYLAFNISNLLTKRLYIGDIDHMTDSDFFRLNNKALVSGLPDLYGVGIGLAPNTLKRHELFCPYVYIDDDCIIEVDYSDSLDYTEFEWYTDLQRKCDHRERTEIDLSEIQLRNGDILDVPVVQPEAGQWSRPYFDCDGGNTWMISYSVPIYTPDRNGFPRFGGIVILDFNLKTLDINQCDSKWPRDAFYNIFRGTHRCPRHSKCFFKSGFGLERGGYICRCKNRSVIRGKDLEDPSMNDIGYLRC